jgi:hypothetical protein
VVGIADNHDNTITLTFVGTMQAQYYVATASDMTQPASWSALAGSTNTVTATNGLWYCTVTNSEPHRYYRSVAITPCP